VCSISKTSSSLGFLGNDSAKTADGATAIGARFSELGGTFLTQPQALAARLGSVRGMIFDWDGVFNRGVKADGSASTFSEADSMGTNLLRYALWRRHTVLPRCAIITGEHNPSARRFGSRENFDALFQGVKDKAVAIDEFCSIYGLRRDELMCIFDDVNDLSMAAGCAVRVLVRRAASPLLADYVESQHMADYITASAADRYAVRETAELLMGLMGVFTAVVESRIAFDDSYRSFLAARQTISLRVERH
jgi:3-deoxy-D-manno-octulosonate 8-phosphate phosphatase (KDO 8-P phosphatase)